MKHIGNLEITSSNAADYAALTEVTGCLEVYSAATLTMTALVSVGGDLYVCGTAIMPALASIGGNLRVFGEATLPSMVSVGGDLDVYGEVKWTE